MLWMGYYHFERLVKALQGRFILVRAGEDPPSVDDLLNQVWVPSDSKRRPYWRTHKYKTPNRKLVALLDLIAAVDRKARRERSG